MKKDAFMTLLRTIVDDDRATFSKLLKASPALATAHAKRGATREHAKDYFFDEILHYVYGGDTPLHLAAAAYRKDALLDGGADPRLKNKNGSTVLQLATQTTGRGGTGSEPAKAQQREILVLLHRA
jgi:hypothetical protein